MILFIFDDALFLAVTEVTTRVECDTRKIEVKQMKRKVSKLLLLLQLIIIIIIQPINNISYKKTWT